MYPTAAGGAGIPTSSYLEPRIISGHAQRAISRLSARHGSPEHKSARADVDMIPARSKRSDEDASYLVPVLAEVYFNLLAERGLLEEIKDLCSQRRFPPVVLEEGAEIAKSNGHKRVQEYILSLWKFSSTPPGTISVRPESLGPKTRRLFLEPLA